MTQDVEQDQAPQTMQDPEDEEQVTKIQLKTFQSQILEITQPAIQSAQETTRLMATHASDMESMKMAIQKTNEMAEHTKTEVTDTKAFLAKVANAVKACVAVIVDVLPRLPRAWLPCLRTAASSARSPTIANS